MSKQTEAKPADDAWRVTPEHPENAVSEEVLLEYMTALSNWGRWGPSDELGTLNLVTPERSARAASLVSEGVSVSCAWDIEPSAQPDQIHGAPQRFMLVTGQGNNDPDPSDSVEALGRGTSEYFGLAFHGLSETHVDALCHRTWKGKMYNGFGADQVTSVSGAKRNAITAASSGVVGRGVLIDVSAGRGTDWLTPPDGATLSDLLMAEKRQNVVVGPGDIVLLRTGNGKRRRELGRMDIRTAGGQSGWQTECLPWLRERDVAMIGCDTAQDIFPNPYSQPITTPVHLVGIVAMGLWLIDNCDLEELAAMCERFGRWEFMFSLGPIRIKGGTGCPANPLATF